MRLTTLAVIAVALAACSKKTADKKEPAPAPAKTGSDVSANAGSAAGSATGSAAGSGTEAAANAGSAAGSGAAPAPARSLTGDLAVSGSLTGTYHWNKMSDLFCGPGGIHIDFTTGKDHKTGGTAMAGGLLDGNGDTDDTDEDAHDLTLSIDTMAPARLDIISLDLPAPMKTLKGFKMTPPGDDHHIAVTIDTTLTDIIVDPDAPKKKPSKKGKKPAGPKVTIKGTLDIDCPPRAP